MGKQPKLTSPEGCREVFSVGMSGFILVAVLLAISFIVFGVVKAQSCVEGDVVNDATLPYPTSECGSIRSECSTLHILAPNTGSYALDVHYPDHVQVNYPDLIAGNSYSYTLTGAEWVAVYDAYNTVYVVDLVSCADGVVYPPDNRANWQEGDHYAVAYVEGNLLSIYNVETGTGVLTLQVDLTIGQDVCSEDSSVCVYFLSDSNVQVNIIDREGKLYEVYVQ